MHPSHASLQPFFGFKPLALNPVSRSLLNDHKTMQMEKYTEQILYWKHILSNYFLFSCALFGTCACPPSILAAIQNEGEKNMDCTFCTWQCTEILLPVANLLRL